MLFPSSKLLPLGIAQLKRTTCPLLSISFKVTKFPPPIFSSYEETALEILSQHPAKKDNLIGQIVIPYYIILAQSEVTACALDTGLELLGEPKLSPSDSRRIIWNRESYAVGGESGILAYEYLVKSIECAANGNEGTIPLNKIVILVDAIRPTELSAIAEGVTWDNLIAMLILTFPEIHWVFGVVSGNLENAQDNVKFLASEHSMSSLLSCLRRDPLFDSLGLRQWVKFCTVKHYKDSCPEFELPKRMYKVAAIDDEKYFAYFYGYTAFRYGYQSDVVTSWSLMKKLFGSDDSNNHGFEILLEDMSLNFPDKENNAHILALNLTSDKHNNPQGREYHFPKLKSGTAQESSKFRVLITTGHDMNDGNTLENNKKYFEENKKKGGRLIYKPVGGMMDLWQNAGLLSKNKLGYARGFSGLSEQTSGVEGVGHGAPGKLMLIAEALLNRATKLLPKAQTTQDFIQGAVLATEATELLSGMTPTLTMQALMLKHEFEVKAECTFVGVGYHFDVTTRIGEIERKVKIITQRFTEKKQQESKLQSLVIIMNRLAKIYREGGRFEEEHECMVKTRYWHRQLIESKTSDPFQLILNLLLRYAEFLLSSFREFIVVILLWLCISSTMWWFIGWFIEDKDDWKSAISSVFSAFFSGTAATSSSSWWLIDLSCIIIGSGFFHLGIFVAYIYSLISRK